MKFDEIIRSGGITPRPPSNLPPPGDQHLMLSLGEQLGEGRVGLVHDVTVIETSVELPRLVVKVSRFEKSGSLAQEAWFYEELEQLQGDSESDESDEEEYDNYKGPLVNEAKYDRELPGEGRVLSILVLEKLGGNIPLRVPLDHIKDDVYELFNDMARLGIEPMDIRWSNILSATDDLETNSSGKICPNHGYMHRWRLVDFDLCQKSDGNLDFIDGCNDDCLSRLFENLVVGRVIEPWD